MASLYSLLTFGRIPFNLQALITEFHYDHKEKEGYTLGPESRYFIRETRGIYYPFKKFYLYFIG